MVVIRPKYTFIVSKLDVLVLSKVFYDLVRLYLLGEIYILKKTWLQTLEVIAYQVINMNLLETAYIRQCHDYLAIVFINEYRQNVNCIRIIYFRCFIISKKNNIVLHLDINCGYYRM